MKSLFHCAILVILVATTLFGSPVLASSMDMHSEHYCPIATALGSDCSQETTPLSMLSLHISHWKSLAQSATVLSMSILVVSLLVTFRPRKELRDKVAVIFWIQLKTHNQNNATGLLFLANTSLRHWLLTLRQSSFT